MTRPVLVGEMNPFGGRPEYALYCDPPTSSGGRLQRLVLGMTERDYLALERLNLCRGRWSLRDARGRAELELDLRREDGDAVFVLLGAKVSAAFRLPFEPFAYTEVLDRGRFLILPHPSGLNRLWNEPGSFDRARAVIREVFPGLRIGSLDAAM